MSSEFASNEPRIALVTGAGSGIGEAMALSLGRSGYHVVVSDLNLDAAQLVSDAIQAVGGMATAFKLDVSDQSAIDSVVSQFPNIDILVNNAGIQYVAKLESFPADMWRKLNDVLLVGPAMLTRAVLPGMKSRDFGRIINVGSIHAHVASPYKSAYVAAKHGLIGFSKVVALETAQHNITINTLCPSYVKTPLVEKQIALQAAEHGISEDDVINKIMLEPMPKKAFISFEELTASMHFLISDAAKNMTGQSLVIDGGWTIK
ncbi:3-hydroxybutyrate dehydrogenase [Saccharophagus degradans]|uniref:3-hydroxybutyrate dehydrogenase n=1 Tax=Saccharophagus degradans (strain 2-40 / ATCC 43961 / DSM 17024) TaxID=203122 RepID=Q21L43_SACD2|nr:3-hydroxybutyrate dehydrogenase [Saccharophagus degradans]ABD80586.1 3-hydroxybutyrate dehydrogenase [Saccharophagus degradans 2-40]